MHPLGEATRVAGVDEVGRGCLAGPVVAAAVILAPDDPFGNLADSKTLSPEKRSVLAQQVRIRSLAWALGFATPAEIDRVNILQATLLAMRRAVQTLSIAPSRVLVDGSQRPVLDCPCLAIVRGDATVPEISAASIVAKVARDALMIRLDRRYPEYGFARNKGYPTRVHRAALAAIGASPVHRRSFSPVRELPG
jgi:ribonuclease HII